MANTHTHNNATAILENGYHGNTITGIAVSDYKHNGKGGSGTPKNIITLPLPKLYKGKFKKTEDFVNNAKELIDQEIQNGLYPSALIVEPISGCGGQVPLAEGYLKDLKPFLEEKGILLIVDEVQTGFGRLGKYFWGFEMHQVVPDIVVLGKPMGNGHPIAAVVATEKIAASFANGMEFFSSFGGNPVSCAVASRVLRVIQDESLQGNALKVGEFFIDELKQLQREYHCIGDVRGLGLFLGIEFVNANEGPNTQLASFIKDELKKNFVLVGTDGPYDNVIKIKPPMCFSIDNAREFVKNLREILRIAAV